MRAAVRWSGVACVLAMSLVTACSSSTSGTGVSRSSLGSSPTAALLPRPGSAPQTSTRRFGSTLQSVAVHGGDLADGYTVRLMPGGDRVAGQVTLDNCGFDFTTEADRVARRQYVVLGPASTDTGLSNELVAYDTAAHAAEALRQWHTSAATCPHRPVRSHVAGEPDMVMRVRHNEVNNTTLPARPNVVTVESGTAVGLGTLYNESILQRHGRYLDAIYLTTRSPITSQAAGVAQQLAIITGRRLAALG